MIESLNIEAHITFILAWLGNNIFTFSATMQIALIMITFGVSAIMHRRLQPPLTNWINKLETPPRVKIVLHNMKKQSLPIVALIIMSILSAVASHETTPFSDILINAQISLLLAWIAIRIAVQIINNDRLRNAAAITAWGIAALSILGLLDDTINALDALGINLGDFRLSALSVIKGILSLLILLHLAGLCASMIDKRLRSFTELSHSSRVLISKFIRVTLVIVAILIAVTMAGIDLTLLAVFSGALGVGLGFGLQKGISNLFSGFLLLMDESIRPGDVLELPNGAFGWVDKMGARYTSIITRDNKSFLIPNEDFVTQQIVNWSHHNTLIRLEIRFGVAYQNDPHLIRKLAVEAARSPDRVVDEPEPVCHLIEFGDSSLNFVLRFWIKDAEQGVTNMRGAVLLAIWDSFKEHGISIPYPHREIFLHDMRDRDGEHTAANDPAKQKAAKDKAAKSDTKTAKK